MEYLEILNYGLFFLESWLGSVCVCVCVVVCVGVNVYMLFVPCVHILKLGICYNGINNFVQKWCRHTCSGTMVCTAIEMG